MLGHVLATPPDAGLAFYNTTLLHLPAPVSPTSCLRVDILLDPARAPTWPKCGHAPALYCKLYHCFITVKLSYMVLFILYYHRILSVLEPLHILCVQTDQGRTVLYGVRTFCLVLAFGVFWVVVQLGTATTN